MQRSKLKSPIWVVEQGRAKSRLDHLTVEEPLEIRLSEPAQTIAVTMRTPGADFELVAGFLYGEGVISDRSDVRRLRYCIDHDIEEAQRYNVVSVDLRPTLAPDLQPLERHFYTTSACGVCGKTSLEALKIRCAPISAAGPTIAAERLYSLPDQLRQAQGLFSATGGLHAAGLFDPAGDLLSLHEDVGRHNALDKLIGAALLQGELPLANHIVLVSGRASFEIMQKCLAARVAIVCSISAPSSLAVSLAQEFGMTLIGFLRGKRFNLYAGRERVQVK